MKFGHLALMDMQKSGESDNVKEPHFLMRVDRQISFGLFFGTSGFDDVDKKKREALGGGPGMRWKSLTIRPLQRRYFLDHPDYVDTQQVVNGDGVVTSLTLSATSEELKAFFEAHGNEESLWMPEDNSYRLEAKLNPGDR